MNRAEITRMRIKSFNGNDDVYWSLYAVVGREQYFKKFYLIAEARDYAISLGLKANEIVEN